MNEQMDRQKPEEIKPQIVGEPAPEDKASGMAIAAMVSGIVGIVCAWIIGLNFALGLAALVLGIIEFKRIQEGQSNQKGKGMALTGIILGSLTLFGALMYIIIAVVSAVSFSTWLPSILNNFSSYY